MLSSDIHSLMSCFFFNPLLLCLSYEYRLEKKGLKITGREKRGALGSHIGQG